MLGGGVSSIAPTGVPFFESLRTVQWARHRITADPRDTESQRTETRSDANWAGTHWQGGALRRPHLLSGFLPSPMLNHGRNEGITVMADPPGLPHLRESRDA